MNLNPFSIKKNEKFELDLDKFIKRLFCRIMAIRIVALIRKYKISLDDYGVVSEEEFRESAQVLYNLYPPLERKTVLSQCLNY